MLQTTLLIKNEDTRAKGGRTYERKDPATGGVATRAAAASVEDAQAAVDQAAAAFPAWSALGPAARRAKLLGVAARLEEKMPAFVEAMVAETGCTPQWAQFNVGFGASLLREAASMTTQVGGEVIPTEVPDNLALAMRQPVGVCLGIAPWNAPVILGVRAIAMALACGNTVVFKASEMCPASHRLIGTVCVEAGLPAGRGQCRDQRPGRRARHRRGADRAPRGQAHQLHRLDARRKDHREEGRRVLEAGPPRARRQGAARRARRREPRRGRQRRIVRRVRQPGTDLYVDRAARGRRGDRRRVRRQAREEGLRAQRRRPPPRQDRPRRGRRPELRVPAPRPPRRRDVEGREDRGRRRHRRHAHAGHRRRRRHEGDAPLLRRVFRAARRRASGPRRRRGRPHRERHGVRSLVGGLQQGPCPRPRGGAGRIESGICHINGPTVYDEGQMPFGGTKGSGYGRFGGKAAIAEFTELRWITIQTAPRHYPF